MRMVRRHCLLAASFAGAIVSSAIARQVGGRLSFANPGGSRLPNRGSTDLSDGYDESPLPFISRQENGQNPETLQEMVLARAPQGVNSGDNDNPGGPQGAGLDNGSSTPMEPNPGTKASIPGQNGDADEQAATKDGGGVVAGDGGILPAAPVTEIALVGGEPQSALDDGAAEATASSNTRKQAATEDGAGSSAEDGETTPAGLTPELSPTGGDPQPSLDDGADEAASPSRKGEQAVAENGGGVGTEDGETDLAALTPELGVADGNPQPTADNGAAEAAAEAKTGEQVATIDGTGGVAEDGEVTPADLASEFARAGGDPQPGVDDGASDAAPEAKTGGQEATKDGGGVGAEDGERPPDALAPGLASACGNLQPSVDNGADEAAAETSTGEQAATEDSGGVGAEDGERPPNAPTSELAPEDGNVQSSVDTGAGEAADEASTSEQEVKEDGAGVNTEDGETTLAAPVPKLARAGGDRQRDIDDGTASAAAQQSTVEQASKEDCGGVGAKDRETNPRFPSPASEGEDQQRAIDDGAAEAAGERPTGEHADTVDGDGIGAADSVIPPDVPAPEAPGRDDDNFHVEPVTSSVPGDDGGKNQGRPKIDDNIDADVKDDMTAAAPALEAPGREDAIPPATLGSPVVPGDFDGDDQAPTDVGGEVGAEQGDSPLLPKTEEISTVEQRGADLGEIRPRPDVEEVETPFPREAPVETSNNEVPPLPPAAPPSTTNPTMKDVKEDLAAVMETTPTGEKRKKDPFFEVPKPSSGLTPLDEEIDGVEKRDIADVLKTIKEVAKTSGLKEDSTLEEVLKGDTELAAVVESDPLLEAVLRDPAFGSGSLDDRALNLDILGSKKEKVKTAKKSDTKESKENREVIVVKDENGNDIMKNGDMIGPKYTMEVVVTARGILDGTPQRFAEVVRSLTVGETGAKVRIVQIRVNSAARKAAEEGGGQIAETKKRLLELLAKRIAAIFGYVPVKKRAKSAIEVAVHAPRPTSIVQVVLVVESRTPAAEEKAIMALKEWVASSAYTKDMVKMGYYEMKLTLKAERIKDVGESQERREKQNTGRSSISFPIAIALGACCVSLIGILALLCVCVVRQQTRNSTSNSGDYTDEYSEPGDDPNSGEKRPNGDIDSDGVESVISVPEPDSGLSRGYNANRSSGVFHASLQSQQSGIGDSA